MPVDVDVTPEPTAVATLTAQSHTEPDESEVVSESDESEVVSESVTDTDESDVAPEPDESGVVSESVTDTDESEVVPEPDEFEAVAPGGIALRLPAPGRIDAHRLRAAAAQTGRLIRLSPRAVRLPVWFAALVAAAWAVAAGMLGATILAALSGVVDADSSLRTTIWLVAHHASLTTDAGTVSLLPLGLLILTVLPARRAGRFLAAQCSHGDRGGVNRPGVGTVGVLAVAGYAALAGLIAATDRTLPFVDMVSAIFWAAVVATCAGAWGTVRQQRGRVPRPPLVVSVAVTVAVPLVIAVLLTAVSVLLAFADIRSVQDQIAQSGMEQVGITLLQVAYLPNLVIWAAAFVMGTGVSLGTDRGLSPFGADEAVLPDLPILAAIPADAPNWTAVLPITVALGGVLGAVVFARLLPEPRLRRRITRAIALALAAGAFWWVLMALAGGSLGDGRLDAVGPAPGSAFVAMVLTGAGTLLWALLPTLASDARPVAVDLRERVSTAATAAKDATSARMPSGKQ